MNKPFAPPLMPWTSESDAIVAPVSQRFDPRVGVDDEALAVASQNAYPVVAKHKARSDSVGLLAGAAIALVLGGVTFVSLNSGRSPKAVSSTSLSPGHTADGPRTQSYPPQTRSRQQSLPVTEIPASQQAQVSPPFLALATSFRGPHQRSCSTAAAEGRILPETRSFPQTMERAQRCCREIPECKSPVVATPVRHGLSRWRIRQIPWCKAR
jgi:hypothetical protein